MKIALASDHAGFPLKEVIKKYLKEHEVTDFGCFNEESMDYPDTGFPAAMAVRDGECERGILICGTGIGMSIVANKVKGIRASLCHCEEFAILTRKHNDSNMLTLPGRFLDENIAIKIVDAWLNTEFENGRHQKRIDKISAREI
ncbi:MAG: ribose 5-phosphate isomerase B [Candidatus Stygibacter australis]|nr:ribose 5-phosphate isomerase B [Candidatus Stygibacter australis]MDP8322363.1 ribose 5-phosphate isomerase B [Candidatus Stygibacter australis]